MGRIINDFEDLDNADEAQDLAAIRASDEDESDAIFAETNQLTHEITAEEEEDLAREYQERLEALNAEFGVRTDKGKAGGSKVGDKDDKEFEWRPANTLDAPEPRPGMVQRWVRFMVGADNDPRNWSRAKREGWTPRPIDTVPAGFNAPTEKHSVLGTIIQVGDVILCEMDARLYKSRKKFFAEKNRKIQEAMEKNPAAAKDTPIRVEERKKTTTFGRRRAQATD